MCIAHAKLWESYVSLSLEVKYISDIKQFSSKIAKMFFMWCSLTQGIFFYLPLDFLKSLMGSHYVACFFHCVWPTHDC